MTKMISFRAPDDVAAVLDKNVKLAGVGRTDYLIGLVLGTAGGESVASVNPTSSDESERLQAALAKSIEYESQLAGLREEIKELKRQLRASREPDAPQAKQSGPPKEPGGAKCPHGQIWKACKWVECRQRVQSAPVVQPHSFHSASAPFAGCAECKKLVKSAATA